MLNETITQSHILLPGIEQSFGILSVAHELSEITVDANGAAAANNSEWRLYVVTPTGAALIWSGDLDRIDRAQRLTPVGGISAGSRVELRGFSRAVVPTTVQVKASLTGYDPACCEDPNGAFHASAHVFILPPHFPGGDGFPPNPGPDPLPLIVVNYRYASVQRLSTGVYLMNMTDPLLPPSLPAASVDILNPTESGEILFGLAPDRTLQQIVRMFDSAGNPSDLLGPGLGGFLVNVWDITPP